MQPTPNPHTPAELTLPALLISRSRGQKDAKARQEDAKAARTEFEAALKANPLLRREWRPLLDEAVRIAGR